MSSPTDEEIEHLLLSGESGSLECKRNATDLDRIREAVCAFANDLPNARKAGIVIVGIEDDGGCAGIDVNDELLKVLGQIRDDGSVTPFPSIEVRRAVVRGCEVAVMIVQPSENPPIRVRGRTWIRVGPRRAVATPAEEQRLVEKRRWGNLPYDAQPVSGSTLADLDISRFRGEYLPSLLSIDTIEQNERTVEEQLRALRLIDASLTPTVTAILMLGKSPQDWFPGAEIHWRRIDGTQLTDPTQDEKVLTGTVQDELRRIDEVMEAANTSSIEMGQSTHSRSSDYPLDALQQLVRNAVMHRTYEGTAAPVRVTWYSDRIEILSPGGTYGAVTPDSFGMPGVTDYRNPTVSEALKGYGFVERFGQGIAIVRRSLERNGNPPPQFSFHPMEAPSWVHVTVAKRT